MRVFFEVLGALGVALAFYLYGYEQGRASASGPGAGVESADGVGTKRWPEESHSETQYFYLERGKSILITAKELVFAIRPGSCGGRGDLICVVLDGKKHSMNLGAKLDFSVGTSACSLELIEFPYKGAKSRFKLACQARH